MAFVKKFFQSMMVDDGYECGLHELDCCLLRFSHVFDCFDGVNNLCHANCGDSYDVIVSCCSVYRRYGHSGNSYVHGVCAIDDWNNHLQSGTFCVLDLAESIDNESVVLFHDFQSGEQDKQKGD